MTAAHASRSCSQSSEPRPVYRRSALPSSSCGVSSTSDRTQRAGAPVASARRAASSSIRGLKSTPTTSSAPRFQSDSVSRPAAHWRWIARRQRPCRSPISSISAPNRFVAAASDLGDRLRQPALVAFRGLVPGRPVGEMHEARIGPFGSGGRADQRGVILHGAEPTSAGRRRSARRQSSRSRA